MDFKFTGMDGDGDKLSSPCSSLVWNSLPEDMQDPKLAADSFRLSLLKCVQCVQCIRDWLQECIT